MWKSFLEDNSGNVAMMFVATMFAIFAAIGFAIDYNGMSNKKLKYQSMADAAVLAAAASGEESPGVLKQIAKDVVNGHDHGGVDLTTNLVITGDNTIQVTVDANYSMLFMDMFGRSTPTLRVAAEAPPKGEAKLNLAMVLDVTHSMSGPKITALQSAAHDLVDALSTDDNSDGINDGDSMFSIVPFARYVELPMSTAAEPWLNIILEEDCDDEIDWDASTNCRIEDYEEEDDGVTYTRTHTVCDVEVEHEVCETEPWEGCVGSRDYPWNTRDYYGGTKIPGLAKDVWCDDPLVPLTSNITTIKDKIDDIDVNDETYIPSGLIWGWRMLSPVAPFTEADTADKADRKSALLLMTDGANTRSAGTGSYTAYHWDHDPDAANTITAELCAGIKADGISVYTVAFEVTDADTIALMRNCATDPSKFFDAGHATDLELAFSDIGKDLAQVRLSK